MRRTFTFIAAAMAIACCLGVPASAGAADPVPVTVMARNLYLGADVGEALALLPDMPAAAQYMWDEVGATDFPRRAPLLAEELATVRPDVVALQEATTWRCRAGLGGGSTVVFDFTRDLLAATEATGVPYVIAEVDGRQALNPGYEIPPLPRLSTVRDPERFPSLFGSETADCGFEIADALLVRADLAGSVRAVGTTEYDERHAVVPLLFQIDRGFAWADVEIGGATIRFVATHLESMWAPGQPVAGAIQARQLAEDLSATELPLVVAGDLNADPRDPRPDGDPNPGGQPEAGEACPPQVAAPTPETAESACNAYWALVQAGFADAGPDPLDPANRTWGSNGLLAGPDPERVEPAVAAGNPYGFTDRLDYVLVRNGVEVQGTEIIGAAWPDGMPTWACDDPRQVELTEAGATALGAEPITGRGACLPTDHAGLVVRLLVEPPSDEVVAAAASTAPASHEPLIDRQWVALGVIALALAVLLAAVAGAVVLIVLLVRGVIRRGRRTSP
jgi:hypothetical protein